MFTLTFVEPWQNCAQFLGTVASIQQKRMILEDDLKNENDLKYQPSSAVGTRSPPAMPHRVQNPKWPPEGPKMADEVWKGVYL